MYEKSNRINQWKEWNEQGFIPGQEESETAFQGRVTFCLNLREHLEEIPEFPFKANNSTGSQELWEEVLPLTQELYGIRPQWVPIFFSNYRLAPWHGGCAWIFQLTEQTPTTAFLQLRNHFFKATHFLGIYHRRELTAHELAHVGRMLYQEPQFEEILAYQSSPSRWRRWLGPLVQSSSESLILVVLLTLMIVFDLVQLFLEPAFIHFAWGVRFLLFGVIFFALVRRAYRGFIFQRCLQNLQLLYSPSQARHLLYRLCDGEIKQFSRFSPLKIEKWIRQVATESFRWRFLQTLYPPSASSRNKEHYT